jgi:parallel beta-helix repeat protein
MKVPVALVTVCLIFSLSIVVLPAKAQEPLNLTINPDGSIDPVGAPIQRDRDIYTLAADAVGISVKCNNITFDGNGRTLSRTLGVFNVVNVTIINFIIVVQNFDDNIFLESCSNVTIANNTLTSSKLDNPPGGLGVAVWGGTSNIITGNRIVDNVRGITFESATKKNRAFGNNITGNFRGLWIQGSQNNSIYNNNFDNNTLNVFIVGEAVIHGSQRVVTPLMNTFDNGTVGNYWSDYNGTDDNRDRTGDTPYVIDAFNQDNYPLILPISITILPTSVPTMPNYGPTTPPTPSHHQTVNTGQEPPQTEPLPTLVIGSVIVVATVSVVLLAYFKKRRGNKRS